MNYSPLFARSARVDRVLVVDDSPDNTFLIQAILEEEGYEIDVLNNGSDALAYINASPPDLLLLDVMMPGMDGFEVTERIRKNAKLPFIPILLITAHDQPRVSQGLDIGADDFIRKPVEFDELLARVRSLLRLKHSVDERDQIARQREDFVSRLTHDLRTPLVAADRMMSLLQQGVLGELSPEVMEALATMERSNQNLLDMVNMLLQVYCYEAGRKTLSLTLIDLRQLLKEVVQGVMAIALDKGLVLQTNLDDDDKRVELRSDRLELHRVFTNLIGNAVKFTDSGSVTVRLSTTVHPQPDKPDKDQWIRVEVEDTGPGISPEYHSSLFEPFRHGNHKRSGSGLGLHLSCQIIKAHYGTIDVQSEVGKGSLFIVELPTYL